MSLKICGVCSGIYDIKEFPVVNGKHISKCIECKRIYQRNWVRNKRRRIKQGENKYI